ncbi:MAG: cytochrome c oxidase, subunit, partial [Gemmatimonadetes bacterium]|nr:cytochrome c oxidase, subunit [Gemmatimonadota bacterium]
PEPGPRQAAQASAQAAGRTTGPTGVAAAMGPQMQNAPATAADGAHAGHDMNAAAGVQQAGFTAFPRERMPAATVPQTPIPAAMGGWDESVKGDPERGRDFMAKFGGGCAGCHAISGVPTMIGQTGPNLTHVASRTTIAGGLYPNDTKHLALWIKNARYMKPGSYMPTLGAFQRDPITKKTVPGTGLSDQQIADIVAYLQALK